MIVWRLYAYNKIVGLMSDVTSKTAAVTDNKF
jgi:hypothetical protein